MGRLAAGLLPGGLAAQLLPGGLAAGLFFGSLHFAAAQTVLNLSANGSISVNPDLITAALNAQSSSRNAAIAQTQVNRAMAQALAAAKAVAGVTATTGDYSVDQTIPDGSPPAATTYQATQSLQLQMAAPGGAPPAKFSALVGRLQENGLLLNGLDGDLSNAAQETAQQGAIDDAIRQIQAQAKAVAAALGERAGKIQTLNVNLNMPGPVPQAMPRMMMAAAAPQAAPAQITVQASVSATIGLTPP